MKKRNPKMYVSVITLLIIIILTFAMWGYYIYFINKEDYQSLTDMSVYERHYVLIPESSDSVLWDNIYESARVAAQNKNAYLELFGDWEAGNYTPLDYIRLAIAAKVDGIILKPDGTAAMRTAINEAEANGIPVVTILNDDSKSARESYVGANSYQLGTAYGKEVLKVIDDSDTKIMILQRKDFSGKELISKEIRSVLQEELPEGYEVEIMDQTIISGNAFDVEEAIRDILHDDERRPDILICMNETDSESAYHTMIDYNLVDELSIIGFFQTSIQLDAISKHTMPAVVTIDTTQVGQYSIDALAEYNDMGYTSSYYSVELDTITQDNVSEYLEEVKEDEN